jgi:thiosulfate dehydrogenase [quinone] large subunit
MINDWAEQGQNSMMALISIVCIFAQADQAWSLDAVFHLFGA